MSDGLLDPHEHEPVPVEAPGPGERWDDSVADSVAIVRAVASDDVPGLAALLANANLPEAVLVLSKLLVQSHCAGCLESGEFARWARRAVTWT